MSRFLLVSLVGSAGLGLAAGCASPNRAPEHATATLTAPALIPRPRALEVLPGRFRLGPAAVLRAADAAARSVAESLARELRASTGFPLPVVEGGAPAVEGGSLHLALEPALGSELGSEGYRLECTPTAVRLTAAEPAGLFYAGQTLRQLLPPEVESTTPVTGVTWEAPCVRIEDRPRFAWRGLMLDSARHFFDVAFVKRFIDLAARHKLNRFHWHLTEDQGWRLEIAARPELSEIGSRRAQTPIPSDRARGDGRPYGGLYTQDDVREVLAYAAEHFVTVVPEIELPGHALAALATYPELSCTGGPFEVGTRWGVHEDVFCAGKEETFAFLESVLGEVVELFPGPYVHVGGDECPKTRWKACADCQARIAAEGLADEHELQAWFVARIERFLNERGKRLIGWDEILEGRLAPNATVMSWRGTKGGVEAARMGHDVVMSPTSHSYFDYYQSEDREAEPPAIGGHLPLEVVYAFEPVPEELDANAARHVLGAQGNLWTEYIPTPAQAEYMTWPRAAALAERVWSPREVRDFPGFRARLEAHLVRLGVLGVRFRALDP